jgi:hypothetical protein
VVVFECFSISASAPQKVLLKKKITETSFEKRRKGMMPFFGIFVLRDSYTTHLFESGSSKTK